MTMDSLRHRQHGMPFGAALLPEGGVRFRLWAPAERRIELDVVGIGRFDAPVDADGWREVVVPQAAAGARYRWIAHADGREIAMPDPASRSNPDGVHAPSQVVDPTAFEWTVPWRGRPWREAVIYELHVGAFTSEGTFAAAEAKLPELAALGITCIELMPVSSFAGRFGWGYDGVLHFAPHAAYGSPDDLKRFIQTAHGLDLMVMLDVVYNHFGPDGNYLALYAPMFFDDSRHTAWGAAIAFDGERSTAVRDFFVHNALYWIHEFGFDGLRLDAVHAILDRSQPDILQEIAARVRDRAGDRLVHLVIENDHNEPKRLHHSDEIGRYDAQWNDDFHHAMHVLLTGEHEGYYERFAADPLQHLARSLTTGFSHYGAERALGGPPLPLSSMVDYIHNHDQIGNRAFGERLNHAVSEPALRLATAVLLLLPSVPMLFMGDEYGARTPFLYFADWKGALRDAVCNGRRREFAHFAAFADEALRSRIPDPCDAGTFERSKLVNPSVDNEAARAWREFHAELLTVRRRELVPRLDGLRIGEHRAVPHGSRGLCVRWAFESVALEMLVNLSNEPLAWAAAAGEPARIVYAVGRMTSAELGPWSGQWRWTPLERGLRVAGIKRQAQTDSGADAVSIDMTVEAEAPAP